MHPAHFNLHSAHLSLHRALYNTLNVIWTLISQVLGNFPKFRPKNSKLSMLTENLRELGGADSKSGHSFLKFGPRNPFLGKFGPKKSMLSVLPENWHTESLEDADSYSLISFLNFLPEVYFRANLGRKSQSCLFCLKIGIWDIWRMLILVATLVFWISNLESIFGQIWDEKVKVVSLPQK